MIPQYVDEGVIILFFLSFIVWLVRTIDEYRGVEKTIPKGYLDVLRYSIIIGLIVLLVDSIIWSG